MASPALAQPWPIGQRPAAISLCLSGAHAVETTNVMIDNFTFEPAQLTVKVGSTVTWENRDDIPHTGGVSGQIPIEDHGYRRQLFVHVHGGGDYKYFCSLHPHMTGRSRLSTGETKASQRCPAVDSGRPGHPHFLPKPDKKAMPVNSSDDIPKRRGAFATPRCRISTTSIRWRATCFADAADAEDAVQECYLRR